MKKQKPKLKNLVKKHMDRFNRPSTQELKTKYKRNPKHRNKPEC